MSSFVAVVDYGAGNLRSAARALTAAGAANVEITADPTRIAAADRIVLPGVGAFAQCITALRGTAGIEAALTEAVRGRQTPFLGVCVGMQLLATTGHEHGVHQGLGWLPGAVTRLSPSDPALKIPHMGWNTVTPTDGSAGGDAYFVHAYRFDPEDPADIRAISDHGGQFPAIVARDNITGVQFHPEKSQSYGLAFLKNWLNS